ncbi:hypothetical protein BDF14DRAFT_1740232 [Spinellus fusiger]|nr:hypothetical protein BDF14DRAFT_1740232 [Spinellus fusiger]
MRIYLHKNGAITVVILMNTYSIGSLSKVYPRGTYYGLTSKKKDNVEYIELHFGDRASCEKACTSPILANGVSISSVSVVSSEDNLLRLNVNQPPLLPYPVVAAGLCECLSPFGVV